jgi:hypothetical protein
MLAQGLEILSQKVEEVAESQNLVQPKAQKSAPAEPKKKPARRTAAKAPEKKAATAPTGAETVFNIISSSEEGADMSTLMNKTGYDRKKVTNLTYRLRKQGKIKSVEKGVYVKV